MIAIKIIFYQIKKVVKTPLLKFSFIKAVYKPRVGTDQFHTGKVGITFVRNIPEGNPMAAKCLIFQLQLSVQIVDAVAAVA